MPGYLPTNDLVGVAWLSQRVAGLTDAMVATTLPRLEAWAGTGFVTAVSSPSGSADIDLPVRHPVLMVDCWAASVDASGNVSPKPPWGKANNLAELVRAATEDGQLYGQPVALPAAYAGARVQAAYLLSEPYRVPDDPSGYAHITFDLAIDWVRVAA